MVPVICSSSRLLFQNRPPSSCWWVASRCWELSVVRSATNSCGHLSSLSSQIEAKGCHVQQSLFLPGRPCHWTATEQMQVQMGNGLAGIFAVVNDKTISTLFPHFVARNFSRNRQQMPQE